jgi:hypothetical protein
VSWAPVVVEIVEKGRPGEPDPGLMILPDLVRINGLELEMVVADSLVIKPGSWKEPSTVTLSLFVSEVHLIYETTPRKRRLTWRSPVLALRGLPRLISRCSTRWRSGGPGGPVTSKA